MEVSQPLRLARVTNMLGVGWYRGIRKLGLKAACSGNWEGFRLWKAFRVRVVRQEISN